MTLGLRYTKKIMSEITVTESVQQYDPPVFENTYKGRGSALKLGIDSALLTTDIVFQILCLKLGPLPANTPTPWQS